MASGDGLLHTMSVAVKSFTCRVNQVSLSRACSELFCDGTEDVQQLVARAVDWLCRRFVQSDFLLDLTRS